jgi:predicted small metal-binding protein
VSGHKQSQQHRHATLNRACLPSEDSGVQTNPKSPQSPYNVDMSTAEVYRFQCGHEQCRSQVFAPTKDDLTALIAQHLKEVHSVNKVTDTLMSYIESTCVTVVPA